jgi:fatty acid desaturase
MATFIVFQIHCGMRRVTKLPFNQNLLNEFFYYVSSYLANFEPARWRHTHFVHHGNTYSTENPFDHEIEYGNDLKETPKGFINEV